MHSFTDKPASVRRACWDETRRSAIIELWPSNTPPPLPDLVYGVMIYCSGRETDAQSVSYKWRKADVDSSLVSYKARKILQKNTGCVLHPFTGTFNVMLWNIYKTSCFYNVVPSLDPQEFLGLFFGFLKSFDWEKRSR